MANGQAYARCYSSEQERRDALVDWLHQYNEHRLHTACTGAWGYWQRVGPRVPGDGSSTYTSCANGG